MKTLEEQLRELSENWRNHSRGDSAIEDCAAELDALLAAQPAQDAEVNECGIWCPKCGAHLRGPAPANAPQLCKTGCWTSVEDFHHEDGCPNNGNKYIIVKDVPPAEPKYVGDDLCAQGDHYFENGKCTACFMPEVPAEITWTDSQHWDAIKLAVATERERCAQIAEDLIISDAWALKSSGMDFAFEDGPEAKKQLNAGCNLHQLGLMVGAAIRATPPSEPAPADTLPKETYWCCAADFGEHEPTCKNYKPTADAVAAEKERCLAAVDRGWRDWQRANCHEEGCGCITEYIKAAIRFIPTEREFCQYCGAGLGKFRRDGEGTCPMCKEIE